MIAYLKGKIKHKGQGFIVIEVNNIGYKIFINPLLDADLGLNQEAELYTYQHVREDALNLYGFKQMADLELFELLISVSGIGPKSGLAIMAIASSEEIKESIALGDSGLLTKVSGIGRKTAERLVLELREKIGKLKGKDGCFGQTNLASSDEIDALMALGYPLAEARMALNEVDKKIKDSGERIRQALKKMGR